MDPELRRIGRIVSILALSLSVCATSESGWVGVGFTEPVGLPNFGHTGSQSGQLSLRVLPLTIRTSFSNRSLSYQQEIELNSSAYAQYLNSNLSNVLFTYENGTPIDAWIQSNATNASTRTIFWLNVSGLVNRTIDLVLYPKETSLLGRESYLGEAPQLSRAYAQFDNGPRVFPFYDDFSGDSLNGSAWTWQGSSRNFTVDNGLTLGDNQWGGILSNTVFDAVSLAPGIFLNFSSSVYLNVAVGTNAHVRLVGGGSGQYLIADPYGFTNGTFVGTGGYGFFSFWTNSSVGHINLANQTLGIRYSSTFGPPTGERLSLRSDSPGWIDVKYALLRQLPVADSGYMPGVTVSPLTLSLAEAGLSEVSFLENGLPRSTEWTLALLDVASFTVGGDQITIALANGTYRYAAFSLNTNYSEKSSPASFIVTGATISIQVEFGILYAVTFRAVGLPGGWLWTVKLDNNVSADSYALVLTISVPNGTYNYSVQTADPTCLPSGGTVNVSGPHNPVTIIFTTEGSNALPPSEIYLVLWAVGAAVVILVFLVFRRRGGKPSSAAVLSQPVRP